MDAANGMVRVAAGRLSGYEWATGDAGGFNTLGNLDGAVGMQLQIKPVDGLNFGAFLPFTYGTSTAPLFSSTDIMDAVNFMAFGAKYTIKGLGDIEGGYWLAPKTGTFNTVEHRLFIFLRVSEGLVRRRVRRDAQPDGHPRVAVRALRGLQHELHVHRRDVPVPDGPARTRPLHRAAAQRHSNFGTYLGFRPTVDYTIGMVDIGVFAEITYVTGGNSFIGGAAYANSSGNLGYSGGPFVKVTFAKNVYLRLQGEFGGGNVTPPSPEAPFVSYPGNISSPYQESAGFTPLSGSFWQANLNFVVSF